MWEKVLQLLAASCRHGHLSQPFPASRSGTHSHSHTEWEAVTGDGAGHYVVCLDCGKHFVYDWSRMQLIK